MGLLILLALESEAVLPALREALLLCYRSVIPSLFPFLVLSGLLISGGFANVCARWLSPVMKPLFRVRGAGALAFVIGVLSGYPTGAKMTAALYRQGRISKTEAERLLPFCNNSGPLFIIGAVGVGMLQSYRLGLLLYGVHVFCAVLVGLCFRFYKRKDCSGLQPIRRQVKSGGSGGLSDAVYDAVETLLTVCGYILLFAALNACLFPVCNKLLPERFLRCVQAISEVSSGTSLIIESGLPLRTMLSLTAAGIGFGGICVILQVKGLISSSGIGLKTYVFGKVLHGAISGVFTYFFYPLLDKTSCQVFAPGGELPAIFSGYGFPDALIVLAICMFCIILYIKFKKRC